jgi:hypothetical protein
MPIGNIASEFAGRIADAVATLLNRPRNSEVHLTSYREIGDHRDLTVPRAEAREAFSLALKKANDTFRQADFNTWGTGSKNLEPLNEAIEQFELGVLASNATPKSIRAAEAALITLSTAVAVADNPDVRSGLKPNDFARILAAQATALDEQVRALRGQPGLEGAAQVLKDVAQNLRQEVHVNYLQQPLEPYSIKEIAGYKALHFDAAIGVIDGILADLKEQASQLPAQGGEVDLSRPVDRAPQKLQEQIKGLEQYRLSLEKMATEAKGEIYQDNNSGNISPKMAKKLLGGKQKTKWYSPPHVRLMNKIANKLNVRSGRLGKPFTQSSRLFLKEALGAHLDGFLQSQGIKGYKQKDLIEQISSGFRDGVESQPWVEIKHDLKLHIRNEDAIFQNTLTPVKELSPQLAQSYTGIQGISSLSNTEPNHAVNLWRTSFQTPNAQIAFSGLRHGVHDAYDIKDPAERVAAADRKVSEFIQAAVQSAPHLLKENADGSFTCDIVSASLLTPSKFNGEHEMLAHQLEAYERANQKGRSEGFQIEIPNAQGGYRTVTVRPNIIGFNSGVNGYALNHSSFGWERADAANRVAIQHFLGSGALDDPIGGVVGEAITKLEAQQAAITDESQNQEKLRLQNKVATIRVLAGQIKEIWNAEKSSPTSHHQVGKEPYKFPVRILALANEIGATPAFNCKSGKDRTGQLDVEVKDFYTHLYASEGRVREINHVRTESEVESFKKIFEDGGAREIQKFNTGIPGNKIDLKIFYDVLGYEKKAVDGLVGLSKWVGS